MPEGDTLYRIANKLRPVLVGREVRDASAWAPRTGPAIDAASLVGQRVASVEARGKHLVIAFEDDRAIHTHLGMTGAWHLYTLGAPWMKPARQAALALSTDAHTAVCFSPKTLELTTLARLARHPHLRRLGPDLMLADVDLAAILPRLRTQDPAPIGQAVMNQTVMAGVGNVYKSESLFLAGFDPWQPVRAFSDQQLLEYLRLTHRLMQQNRRGGLRTTRFGRDGPRVWVYGRQGEACLRCGETIRMRRQGDSGRSTYWCPACQPSSNA